MTRPNDSFQELMVELTRAFGWHRPTETPCGRPVSISEAHALLELSRVASLTQKELGAALNLRKSSVSHLVGNLLGRNWVERSRNKDDGRAWDVRLSSAGAKVAQEVAAARKHKMEKVLARIPAQERGSVMQSLTTLIGAIHESDT